MYTHRFITKQEDQRRRPSERDALIVWKASRPDVFRRALLECELPPDLTVQIQDVDSVMLDIFNLATAQDREGDVPYLIERSVQRLKTMWVPRRAEVPVRMAGSLPIPEYDSSIRRNMHLEYLR